MADRRASAARRGSAPGRRRSSASPRGEELPRAGQGQEHGPAEGSGARAFWSGTLSFGLVSIPVELHAAVRPRRISLRMLDPEGRPLQRRYYCSREGRPLERDEIVRGYQVTPDQFLVISDHELEALEPERSRDIDLRRFVPRGEIDPLLLERPYVLAPAGDSSKAYVLLAAVLERTGRAGIATFVMRGKEYLTAILSEGGLLRAFTLRFDDEVRSAEQIGLPAVQEAPPEQRQRVEAALRGLERPRLEPELLRDVESAQILELARNKRAEQRDVVVLTDIPPEEPDQGEVVDIMELLKQRLEAPAVAPARSRGRPAARGSKTRWGSARREARTRARAERRKKAKVQRPRQR